LSPNRGERLANLKRRQVEKRATSAVGSTRASNPWDSNDSSISTATAALSAAGDASLTASLTGAEGLLQARRASTAGGSPGSSLTSSWRLSNAGAASIDGAGSGSEGGAAPPAHIGTSSGRGPLLNWHIPTGADGRFITPSAVISTQQQQQQQQQFGSGNGGSTSSQQPWGEAARGGSSSPSGWGSSLSASRAVQGHVQAGTNSSSSQQQQQQQQPHRSVSAAAVLTATGSDAQADSSNGSLGQRSSRFQQVNGGGSAPPPPVATATTGPGSPMSSSRLNSGSGLWMLRQQQQQQQAQGLRTQSAAAVFGAAAAAAAAAAGVSEWGSTTSSRLSSAGAPLSSTGGLHTATLGSPTGGSSSHQQPGVFASGAGASGGPASPSRQMAPSLSGRSSNGLRGVLGLETRPAAVGASALAGDADLEALELSPLSDPEATLRCGDSRQ
jgi:hypothetical protein